MARSRGMLAGRKLLRRRGGVVWDEPVGKSRRRDGIGDRDGTGGSHRGGGGACSKCGILGHVVRDCPRNFFEDCSAPMCGFQAKGQGLFFIPPIPSEKTTKDKNSSVVITVVEGVATARQVEAAFNLLFAGTWRCSARPIGPDRFVMRFPNAKKVEEFSFFKGFVLQNTSAKVNVDPWTPCIGAKGEMDQAWVKAVVAFVGSLVGVTLDIDPVTLSKPEYVRIKLGCVDAYNIAASAEGYLGTLLYDFFFECESVIVSHKKNNEKATVLSDVRDPEEVHTPKRHRFNDPPPKSTPTKTMGGSSYGGKKKNATDILAVDEEEEEESENAYNDLLIDTMCQEAESVVTRSEQIFHVLHVVPEGLHLQVLLDVGLSPWLKSVQQNFPAGTFHLPADVRGVIQALCPGVDWTSSSPYQLQRLGCSVEYMHEDPVCFSDNGGPLSQDSQQAVSDAELPAPLVKKPVAPVRFSDRLSKKAPTPTLLKATALLQKKNSEGMCPRTNSFSLLGDDVIISRAQAMGAFILNDTFSTVNILKELETARDSLLANRPVATVSLLDSTPPQFSTSAGSVSDHEDFPPVYPGDDFTLVSSRKLRTSKTRLNPAGVIGRSSGGSAIPSSLAQPGNGRATRRGRKKKNS
ncbi:hypothetical protein BRADI_4g28417v3 [Brachypodium distachyon]|uniref:CCHC-type domain-containing protein n=1 Tax=Brachypodium distachyon TaxID=15368 RepID=A0A2K2CQW4_BRADI|nr:hypothetical protein BRADI_4g28417v3 [Brachypodium distachyon]